MHNPAGYAILTGRDAPGRPRRAKTIGGMLMFKILIAEDDRELRQLFAHVLTKNG